MPILRTSDQKKLLLVDDHPIVTFGVRALLEDSNDFILDQVASSQHEAISLTSKERPDIVILDLLLPGRHGIELIPELLESCPKSHIVVYSSLEEDLYAARAIQAGAKAYVHKEAGLRQLLDTLYGVCQGKICVSEEVAQAMLSRHAGNRNPLDDLSVLSNQELNVFRLIGKGLRLSDIAAKLGISPKTVGTHRERIKNKLTLHSGKELDQLAMSRFSSLPKQSVQE